MMPTLDSRPQPFNNGQRQQQRHPENEPVNGFLPATSSDNFLLPVSQGGFTFSAEPAMMDYSSMNGLPVSNTHPQETVFTPNTGSSFDSSLHPDLINSSYPPPNVPYMQHSSSYTLSPGMNSHTGHSLSPSHSNDHISPDAGYISESNYQDLSTYNTPGYGSQYIDEPFPNINVTNDVFETFSSGMQMTLPISDDVLATYNAQAHQPLHTAAYSESQSQLISPCATNNSSPIIGDEVSRNMSVSRVQYNANQYRPSSSPPEPQSHTLRSTPSKQQHSPARTNSPGNMALASPQPRAHHLTSPIVRVENYSRGGSPSRSDTSRPVSKRSHESRRSRNHLSVPADDSSDEEDVSYDHVRTQPVVRSAERGEDGAWLPSAGLGQAGLNPEDRDAMKDALVPSLDEITEQRLKNEKKLEVVDWLSKSEVGSEAGDAAPSIGLLKPFSTRRRAKSTNDAHRQGFGANLGLGVRTDFTYVDDSGIPGPGLYIDERSEFDEYEEDDEEDDDEPESPVALVDPSNTDVDVSYFPPAPEDVDASNTAVRPWNDTPAESSASSTRYQPPTSNAAMMRFRQRAKDVESASLAATVGSRRKSESDFGSIKAAPGVIKAIESGRDLKEAKDRQRRPSFLQSIIPKRTPSNLLKRKTSIPVQPPESTPEKAKEPVPEKPKRIGSWGRPKSPRLDTSVASHGRDVGPPSTTNLSATSGPWATAKNAIKRSRSRSDLGRSPGLAELMTQHGGPPMPMLASPLAETEATKHSPFPSPGGDDDDDDPQETITMDLKVRSDPIIPTMEGFKTHARQLNPRLVDYMVERITQEQMRRYKRLLEFRVKHLNAVKNRNCSSNKFCTALGGESKQLPPRAGNKDSEAPFIGFQITAPGSSDDDGEPPPEGTVVSAQFPSGVPLPPVKRLPAEFECPLCFKVKKFYKPSDWTKHVHEDVQPFTCTFPNCGEPKSFKRKADWVRHENERHRQLENWTCCIADCNHTCYRKDNFVQHLVREHKIAEPRARTGRGGNKDASANTDSAQWAKDNPDDIWKLVENCRRDTTKLPKDEPCRFCGNICNSWKKLTVHLAKHMEQISMPILPLVEAKQMNADTIISPVVEMPESRKLSVTPNRSPVDNPSRYIPNNTSTLAPGIDPSFGQFPPETSPSTATSNVMHTYPPPQLVAYRNQQAPAKTNYGNFVDNGQNYGRSYPGLQEPPKNRGAYVNGLQIPNQPYHNGSIQNGPNRYPMTPVSAIGQQQAVFTTSPVDTTPYTTDALGSTTYFTQEPQTLASGGVADMGFDATNTMQYQPSAYQEMSYMSAQQHNYQYQGQ